MQQLRQMLIDVTDKLEQSIADAKTRDAKVIADLETLKQNSQNLTPEDLAAEISKIQGVIKEAGDIGVEPVPVPDPTPVPQPVPDPAPQPDSSSASTATESHATE